MKKIFILICLVVISFARYVSYASNDYTYGTLVEYVAKGSESYSVTVPAKLSPGESGTVTLDGTWGSNRIINVSADKTVELVNSLNSLDKRTLDITFVGINEVGNDFDSQKFDETIIVSNMPSDVLFGTWTGKFNYALEVVDKIYFDVGGNFYSAEKGMTWREWIAIQNSFVISDFGIDGNYIFYGYNDVDDTYYENIYYNEDFSDFVLIDDEIINNYSYYSG